MLTIETNEYKTDHPDIGNQAVLGLQKKVKYGEELEYSLRFAGLVTTAHELRWIRCLQRDLIAAMSEH